MSLPRLCALPLSICTPLLPPGPHVEDPHFRLIAGLGIPPARERMLRTDDCGEGNGATRNGTHIDGEHDDPIDRLADRPATS
jgi:hypothetical protein